MALKTLEAHDAEQTAAHAAYAVSQAAPVPTGIQCPQCAGELVNPDPRELVPALDDDVAPRINVRCDELDCDYVGTAVQKW